MVDKYWGGWKRGSYQPDIPVEPRRTAPRTTHVDWPAPTLPWIDIAFRTPAYALGDTAKVPAFSPYAGRHSVSGVKAQPFTCVFKNLSFLYVVAKVCPGAPRALEGMDTTKIGSNAGTDRDSAIGKNYR